MSVMLLSEEKLKNESVIQENVDPKIIKPVLKEVQSYYIIPIIGSELYNDIQTTYPVWSADYLNLIDNYIQPVMIQYALFELPWAMNYKYFNKSVGTQDAENMEPADLEELTRITNNRKNKAEYFSERLTRFLIANPTKFPLYLSSTNIKTDTVFAQRNNYTSGMNLDKYFIDELPSKYDIDLGKFRNCHFCY